MTELRNHRVTARCFHDIRQLMNEDDWESLAWNPTSTAEAYAIVARALDTAHLDHWHALQAKGMNPGDAGDLCARITHMTTKLPA